MKGNYKGINYFILIHMFKLCIKILNSIFLVNKTFLVIEYNCVKSLVKPVKGIMGV